MTFPLLLLIVGQSFAWPESESCDVSLDCRLGWPNTSVSAPDETGAENYYSAYRRAVKEDIPLLVLVGGDWCPACRSLKAKLIGWGDRKDIAFAVIDANHSIGRKILRGETVPELVYWRDVKQSPRRIAGDRTAKSVEEFLDQRIGRGRRTLRNRRWTWPGMPSVAALETHLASRPHNYDRAYLVTLADQELGVIHDAWHNRHGAR